MNRNEAITQVRSASGLNVIAGLWLILAPFALGFTGGLRSNSVIVGIIVAVLAIIRVSAPMSASLLSWANAVLGLWMIASPFALGYVTATGLWNSVIMGIIVAGLAIWSGSVTASAMTGSRTTS